MKEHDLIAVGLLLAYFITNIVVAVKFNIFTQARGRNGKYVLYAVAFLLEGSLIMLSIGILNAMRRLDSESN